MDHVSQELKEKKWKKMENILEFHSKSLKNSKFSTNFLFSQWKFYQNEKYTPVGTAPQHWSSIKKEFLIPSIVHGK